VKVDPKSIGVGQYQHDVDQRQLQQSLEAVTESCVNRVGVDLNTASWTLLRYVAGITERTALNIVSYRDQNGRFRSRSQLKEVAGVGAKTFEQAAGFLRIRGGDQPLDMTAVHPESYLVVQQIASSLNAPVEEIIRNPQILEKVDRSKIDAGTFTFNDILEELRKPGRDPRDKFVAPSFNEQVRELSDVQVGMVLEGVVTNVTKFGAFVDVGVHQDGLVHISEISNRFIKEPSEALKTGQIVKVKVMSCDVKSKRIALSIKALLGPAQAAPKAKQPPPKPPATMNDALASPQFLADLSYVTGIPNLLADEQLADVHPEFFWDIAGQTFEFYLARDHFKNAALHLHALGFAESVHRHLDAHADVHGDT